MSEDWNKRFTTTCQNCKQETEGYFFGQTHVSCPHFGINLTVCSPKCAIEALQKVVV